MDEQPTGEAAPDLHPGAGAGPRRAPGLPGAHRPILEIDEIGKSYGSVISLYDITTTVRAGEVTCVLGDNGAGKSTLIKILSGVHEHDARRVPGGRRERQLLDPREALTPASPRSSRTWPWCR